MSEKLRGGGTNKPPPPSRGRGRGRGGKDRTIKDSRSDKGHVDLKDSGADSVQESEEAREARALAAREEERQKAEEKAKQLAETRARRRAIVADIRERMVEAINALQKRVDFRNSNLDASKTRLDINMKALDSSIKKNEALIKKLRMISADNKDTIVKGIQEINMTKFISESVDAVADAKLKSSDIPAAVQIISLLHLRYSEFSRLLIGKLAQAFAVPKKEVLAAETETERKDRLTRRRSTLRLLAELLVAGVLTDPGVLLTALRELISQEAPTRDTDGGTSLVALIAGFVKYAADDILGLPPQWRVEADLFIQEYKRAHAPPSPPPAVAECELTATDGEPAAADEESAEDGGAGGPQPEDAGDDVPAAAAAAEDAAMEDAEQDEEGEREAAMVRELEAELARDCWEVRCVGPEPRAALLEAVHGLFGVLAEALRAAHAAVRQQERENRRLLAARGELSEEAAKASDRVRAHYEKLSVNVRSLAEALQVPMPEMPKEDATRIGEGGGAAGGGEGREEREESVFDNVFEDDDTRDFYQDLPNLYDLVPSVLLGEAGRPKPPAPEEAAGSSAAAAADGSKAGDGGEGGGGGDGAEDADAGPQTAVTAAAAAALAAGVGREEEEKEDGDVPAAERAKVLIVDE